MDIYTLRYREQEERMRAEAAKSISARRAHEALANCFEHEIRRRGGVDGAGVGRHVA